MHSVCRAQNLCIITYMQHQVQVSISRKECSDLLGIKKPINHSLFCTFAAHLLQAALELAYSLYKIYFFCKNIRFILFQFLLILFRLFRILFIHPPPKSSLRNLNHLPPAA